MGAVKTYFAARNRKMATREVVENFAEPVEITSEGTFPLVGKVWPSGVVLDQGSAPQCAGFAAAAMVLSAKASQAVTKDVGDNLGKLSYKWQVGKAGRYFSKYPGASYADIFCLENNLALKYGTSDTIEGMAHNVVKYGAHVVGMSWFKSFSQPREGLISIKSTENSGSHFVCIIGFDPEHDMNTMKKKQRIKTRKRIQKGKITGAAAEAAKKKIAPRRMPAFLIRNSYSASWGENGNAWISAADLKVAMSDHPISGSNGYVTDWNDFDVNEFTANLEAELE